MGKLVYLSCGETGSMDRTSQKSFTLQREESGTLVFSAEFFVKDTEVTLENIQVDERYADDIRDIALKYDMFKRKAKAIPSLFFALDASEKFFFMEFENADKVSLNDGYKKSDGFAKGYNEIVTMLFSLANSLYNASR